MVSKMNRRNTGIQLDRREECSYDRLVLRRSVYYSHTNNTYFKCQPEECYDEEKSITIQSEAAAFPCLK